MMNYYLQGSFVFFHVGKLYDYPKSYSRWKSGLQFVHNVQSLALGLSNLGLKIGDIVAIAALNSDFYLEWMLAVAYVGAILSPLNYRWSLEEATSALLVLKPVMLVLDHTCAFWYFDLQTYNLSFLRWHVCLGHDALPFLNHIAINANAAVMPSESLKNSFKLSPSLEYQWAPEGVVLICFTSGTSGRPKGVAIGHTALIVQSLAKIDIVGYNKDDVYLHAAPLCHIGGISSGMAMLMVAACNVILPKFESKSVLKAIEQHHVSSLITVPAMMADLISCIRSCKTWKAGILLKKILNGGGQLSVELIRDATEIFSNAKLISAYGMTETCSSLTFMTLYQSSYRISEGQYYSISEVKSDLVNHMGVCVGKPAPHVELSVSGNGPSSIGRILTRGPHIMLKYWNQAPLKISDSQCQGWLDTGDIGYMDDYGDIWLVGRANDRIKSGGENVYPEEVETILMQHPGVSSIVVVGVPDARLSEMVVACLQIKESWMWVDQNSHTPERKELQLSSESLYKYCKEKNLTRFKIPKIFIPWRRPFPLTSTGKLRRDEVRREAILQLHLFHSKL
ncbi:2-succinylbenzoate--CoA ligase, chloroplastic/peroxisomal [Thalictrum thalictroides]|uniref:2-succinylbenzoate--CoA ligase, chloroplastic/peroxisomal n=1 Tax=Thalictrum thalictroides TaxID=46969 RepID=A0A7J6X4G2_THATH|nr:2-succinylbenzoate--CoA ligase, chloroplastic/peroxisomal [Thalictrum thalictroides]